MVGELREEERKRKRKEKKKEKEKEKKRKRKNIFLFLPSISPLLSPSLPLVTLPFIQLNQFPSAPPIPLKQPSY